MIVITSSNKIEDSKIARVKLLTMKMVTKNLITNDVVSVQNQFDECMKFNDDCLTTLEKVVDKQP